MNFEDSINKSDFEDDINMLDEYANRLEDNLDGIASSSSSSDYIKDEDEDISRAIEMSLLDHDSTLSSHAVSIPMTSKKRKKLKKPVSDPVLESNPVLNRGARRQIAQLSQKKRSSNGLANNMVHGGSAQQIKTFKFRSRPMQMLPDKYQGQFYNKINQSSDKIIIPERLISSLYGTDNPIINDDVMIVEIHTHGNRNVQYGTISQYIEEDICYLPDLMFYGMSIEIDTICHFRIVDNITKAKRVVLKPEIYEFMHIKDQMKLMFDEFNTNFRLLRVGQQIVINSNEVNMDLTFIIDQLYDNNNKIIRIGTINDVDLEVEFKLSPEFNQRYIDEMAEKKRVKEAEDRERRLIENPPVRSMRFNRSTKPNINTYGSVANKDNDKDKSNPDQGPNNNSNGLTHSSSAASSSQQQSGPTESFQGDGNMLGGRTDRLLSRDELRRKRLQNLKFLGKGNKLSDK